MSANPAFGTPTIVVRSNRGVPVRALTYNRQTAAETLVERVERTVHVHADDPDLQNAYVVNAPDKNDSPRRRRSNPI
jgi:hypothetical protein